MEQNAKFMCHLFKENKPFLIGRNGSIELQMLIKNIYNVEPNENEKNQLELNAGIFPRELFPNFFNDYIEAIKSADAMAEGWYEPLKDIESKILDIYNKDRYKLCLRNLEPYYVEPNLRWTQYLAGKRVAIISPFATICEEQTYMSKAIWPDNTESLLPTSTKWIPINTFYSPRLASGKVEWPKPIQDYNEAIDYIVAQVLSEGCKVAIIGCGGMGMIIGHKLKKEGLQCIVMGGATQILFGIKGKRWVNHDVISNFFNDAWVYPSNSYKPSNYSIIENGCYW